MKSTSSSLILAIVLFAGSVACRDGNETRAPHSSTGQPVREQRDPQTTATPSTTTAGTPVTRGSGLIEERAGGASDAATHEGNASPDGGVSVR